MTGSEVGSPAGTEVGWTKGAGSGSGSGLFSDKRAGVSTPAGTLSVRQ